MMIRSVEEREASASLAAAAADRLSIVSAGPILSSAVTAGASLGPICSSWPVKKGHVRGCILGWVVCRTKAGSSDSRNDVGGAADGEQALCRTTLTQPVRENRAGGG